MDGNAHMNLEDISAHSLSYTLVKEDEGDLVILQVKYGSQKLKSSPRSDENS